MKKIFLSVALACASITASAQSELYPQHFDLEEVTLGEGAMKTAQELNVRTLMSYDVDRLLTPYVRQALPGAASGSTFSGKYAGWEKAHPNFENWGSGNFRLDGHVGGHYMTALALAYAATRDVVTKNNIRERVGHMLVVLKDCQDVYDNNKEGLYGFIGGQPCNDAWKATYAGNVGNFGSCAVPLYCQHKILAGLRDMYIYMDGQEAAQAKELYRKLCDWHVNLISKLSDDKMQAWLDTEHGGVNETLVDAYKIFADNKYLAAAKRYSHNRMVNGMQTLNPTFLDNNHANTQVPKYIGFARISAEDKDAARYSTAAMNFWTDVVSNRTVCIGGNSMNEWFNAASAASRYVEEANGPESCNSNNMLKLSENLFDATHDAKYVDFYESTTWNHILSTQDPLTGGYVYFTPLRPQSYRIYSKENQDMWCCVGTGMENHSKYAHFIYTHSGQNTLYVNLFVPSVLDNGTFGITQQTEFPYSQQSTLTIDRDGEFTMAIRKPSWVGEGFAVVYNGVPQDVSATKASSYYSLHSSFKKGDKIVVSLPMTLRYEQCPNLPDYIAFKYGPILLGARTTSASADDANYESLYHEYALGERMGHAPDSYCGKKSLASAPLLLGERSEVLSRISADENSASTLQFSLDASRSDEFATNYSWKDLTLAPYYTLHHTRVSNYFYQATVETYLNSEWAKKEAAVLALDARTISFIATGEQQSEAGVTSWSTDVHGSWSDENYRSAEDKAMGWVQYVLANPERVSKGLSIMLRFARNDAGRRGAIYVNDALLDVFSINDGMGTVDGNFVNYEIALPESFVYNEKGAVNDSFTLKVVGSKSTYYPSLYFVRLMKETPVDVRSIGESTSIKTKDENGKYINYKLYNVATGRYYDWGAQYNAHAALGAAGTPVNLVDAKRGYYLQAVGSTLQMDNDLWMDRVAGDPSCADVTFVPVDGADNVYYIMCTAGGDLLTAPSNVGESIFASSDMNSSLAKWQLFTIEDIMQKNSDEGQNSTDIDITALLNYPDFNRGEPASSMWGDLAQGGWNDQNGGSFNAESFNSQSFDFHQTIHSMPAGKYKVTCQAFYRDGGIDDAVGKRKAGTETVRPQIYVDGQAVAVHSILDEAGKNGSTGVNTQYGYIPNNQSDAAHYFDKGLYEVELEFTLDEPKDVVIGIKKSEGAANDWTCFDKFRLYRRTGAEEMTSLIVNPSFEADGKTLTGKAPKGWTLNRTDLGWYGVNKRNGMVDAATDGDYLFGIWDGQVKEVSVSQHVTLPNGRYMLTVDMLASNRDNGLARVGRQCVFADDVRGFFNHAAEGDDLNNEAVIYNGDNVSLQTIKVYFDVEEASKSVEIGAATSETPNESWFKVDNFRLYRLSSKGPDDTHVSNVNHSASINNNHIFDLSGRQLAKMERGINIKDGKKIVVR